MLTEKKHVCPVVDPHTNFMLNAGFVLFRRSADPQISNLNSCGIRMLIKHVHKIPPPDHTSSQLNLLKTSQPILPVVSSHQSPVIHLKQLALFISFSPLVLHVPPIPFSIISSL